MHEWNLPHHASAACVWKSDLVTCVGLNLPQGFKSDFFDKLNPWDNLNANLATQIIQETQMLILTNIAATYQGATAEETLRYVLPRISQWTDTRIYLPRSLEGHAPSGGGLGEISFGFIDRHSMPALRITFLWKRASDLLRNQTQ